MRHRVASSLLPLYALDALVPAEQFEVARHLLDCEACWDELDRFLQVVQHLCGELELSPDLWPRIEAAIDVAA